jgi:hypothetical protein
MPRVLHGSAGTRGDVACAMLPGSDAGAGVAAAAAVDLTNRDVLKSVTPVVAAGSTSVAATAKKKKFKRSHSESHAADAQDSLAGKPRKRQHHEHLFGAQVESPSCDVDDPIEDISCDECPSTARTPGRLRLTSISHTPTPPRTIPHGTSLTPLSTLRAAGAPYPRSQQHVAPGTRFTPPVHQSYSGISLGTPSACAVPLRAADFAQVRSTHHATYPELIVALAGCLLFLTFAVVPPRVPCHQSVAIPVELIEEDCLTKSAYQQPPLDYASDDTQVRLKGLFEDWGTMFYGEYQEGKAFQIPQDPAVSFVARSASAARRVARAF